VERPTAQEFLWILSGEIRRNNIKKSIPNDPSKWSSAKSKAKRKFKVYPSAYANAWAAKEYKRMGGTWRGADNRVTKRGKK